MKRSIIAAGFFFCVFLATTVSAAPPATTCSVSTTGLSFGNYDVLAPAATTSTSSIAITCDKNANLTISIGSSPTSGGFNPRQMKLVSGADLLNYNLYTDAGATTIWGDGTAGTSTVPGKFKKSQGQLNVTIYGTIPALQNISAGLYNETVTVTIVW